MPTGFRSLSEARPALERALRAGPGAIKSEWVGEELRLTGPGAEVRVVCENGELVGHALLRPPASLLATTIRSQFESVLREAAAAGDKRDPE